MIRSVLVIRPKAGCEGDVIALFRRAGVFEQAMSVDGCVDVTMLKRDEEILVTGSWTSAEAYDAWIDHPERNSVSDELNDLLDVPITPETVANLYEVVLNSEDGPGS